MRERGRMGERRTERQHVRVIAIIWEIEEWGGWREKNRETACESDSYYMEDRGMGRVEGEAQRDSM